MRARTVVAATGALLAGALIGMTLAARDYPPYTALEDTLTTELFADDLGSPADARAASAPLLRVTSRAEGLALRRRLRRAIWGAPSLRRPEPSLTQDVETKLGDPLPGTARTDELLVRQVYGIDSRIEIHVPDGPPRGFVIAHGGHAEPEHGMRSLLEQLAERRYVVAVIAMPLIPWNPQPDVQLPAGGTLTLTSHDLLPLLPHRLDSLLALFLDPVRAVIDHARELGFATVDMVGLSGGAWTTTLSAALDPRIRRSYAVAGSVPMYLRSSEPNQGDFEQMGLPLYRLADYDDLYALGALESGRRQRQIHNDSDSCCYALSEVPAYATAVREALEQAGGGSFELRIVDNDEHEVGSDAEDAILRDLGSA